MHKIFSVYFTTAILALSFSAVPQSVFSADLTFKVIPNTEVGDSTTIIEVRIDPQSKKLNVVEGAIGFSGPASDNLAVQVENGQSILPMWPTAPQYDKTQKVVNFTGGIPNGFDSEGLLFRLRLSPTLSGDLYLTYQNGSAYLNDGKGTKEPISSQPLKIQVNKSAQNEAVQDSSGFFNFKYAIIVLLIVFLFITFYYVQRKNTKI